MTKATLGRTHRWPRDPLPFVGMPRATSSGWTCSECGTQRIRTMEVDTLPSRRSRAKAVTTKCPACGHAESITPSDGERIISIRYDPA